MDQDLLGRVLRSPRLPSLPTIAMEVVELVQQPNVNIEKIAQTICNDPALAAKILRTVNSSFYARSRAVTTITQAVIVLGINSVKTLVLGFSLVGNTCGSGDVRFDHAAFWKRSVYAATAARHLSRRAGMAQQEEAFLAGLMQDLGVLALHQALGEPYARIAAEAGAEHSRLAPLERQHLDLDHLTVGAALAERWKLPSLLALPIQYHEESEAAPGHVSSLVRCVSTGSRIADLFMGGRPAASLAACYEALDHWFGLDRCEADPLLREIHQAAAEMSRLFDLPAGDLISPDEILARANEALLQISLETQMQSLQLREQNQQLVEQARTDPLTGASNRRRFDTFLEQAFVEASATAQPLSLLFLDVDHFKHLNDTHGHPAGDRVLVAMARLLIEMMPPNSLVVRYGGEEFAVVLPQADGHTAGRLAENARQKLQEMRLTSDDGRPMALTVSLGVATVEKDGVLQGVEQLTAAADQAVYAAKAAGRNCVRIFAPRVESGVASSCNAVIRGLTCVTAAAQR